MSLNTTRALLAFLVAFACAFAAAPCAAAEPSVAIEMRPAARLDQGEVRLGDVAFITSNDLATLRRLMAMPLGHGPRPGESTVLDRETVERWVEARSGLQIVDRDLRVRASGIRWSGASEVFIESAAQQVSGDTVVKAARAALVNWLSQRSVRAEIEPVSISRDLMLPPGVASLRVRPLAEQGRPTKRMLVWVDAWVDDRFVRSTAVTFDVAAWAALPVTTAGVAQGAVIDPVVMRGALQTRDIDLTAVKGTPVAALDDGSQRLRRPLKEGEVLTSAKLERTPAVIRGAWAHLLARSGEVSVESRVEVLQDGREGQVVRVKVPGSSGEVLARVTGPGQVEVQP